MNLLTTKQYLEVERLAGLFFTEREIITIMQISEEHLINDSLKVDFNSAYLRGKLKSEAEIRDGILRLAKNGSSPAQILAMQIVDKATLNNIEV